MINQSRYKWNAEFCFQRQLRLQTSWQNDFKYAISFCYGMDFAYVLSYVLAPKIMMENVRHNKQTPWEIEGQGTARAGDWCNFLLAHSNCQEAAWHQKWSQKKLICHSGLHFIIHPHIQTSGHFWADFVVKKAENWMKRSPRRYLELIKSRLDQNFCHCFIFTSYSHLWDLFLIPWRSIAASSLSSTFFTSWIAGT